MISKLALATALAFVPGVALAQTAPAPAAPPAAQPDAQSSDDSKKDDIVVTGRFVDTGAKSAMKMNVSVLDTPATVASYSQAFVKSLDTSTVSDLYNYMTGIKKSGNTGYDITLRGFKGSGDDRNTILVDGLPGLTGRYGSPPTVNIDHIELVKGPTSVLYGQNQPGGFINLITKKPLSHFENTIELRGSTYAGRDRSFGDHNGIQGEFDSTGPLTSNGALLYRLDGSLSDVNGFRDGAHTTQQFISPSLTWKIGSGTTLTVQAEYRHVREHMDNGIVAPSDGTIYSVALADKRTASYQQPDDYRIETGKAVNAFFTQDLGADWHFNASYRHVSYTSDQKSFDQTGFVTVLGQNEVQRRARALATARRYDYLDTNIQGKFNTGPIQHQVLVGFNIGSNDTEENRTKFYNSSVRNAAGVCPATGQCLEIPVYSPANFYGNYPSFDSLPALNPQLTGQALLLTDKFTKGHNYGIYVSDLITFLPWLKVSVAGRKFSETSAVEGDHRNAPGVIARRTDNKDFLPSLGLLLEPSKHITIYGSYSESFVPADPSAIDGNGNVGTLHPITAAQYEAGVKAENIFDRKLTFTAALYRIDQDGQVTQNPCAFGTCSFQTGKGRSDGFEVQGDAEPFQNFQLLFGYSHIVAKILTAPGLTFQVGDTLPNVARDALNLWSRYSFGQSGFSLGAGFVYTGPRQGLLPTAATDVKLLPLPGYTTVDLGVYYDKPHYSINMKMGNVFDARYFESAGATGRIQLAPGAPRNLTLSVRYKF